MAERYGDRLGYLLRRGTTPTSSSSTTSSPVVDGGMLQTASDAAGMDQEARQQINGGGKKKQNEERGWVVLGSEDFSIRIASGVSGSVASNEVSVLFKIVEQLKAKLAMLQTAQKILYDLPMHGFRSDQRLLVVFRDGLPKQVIPTNEISAHQRKFRYADQFQIAILK